MLFSKQCWHQRMHSKISKTAYTCCCNVDSVGARLLLLRKVLWKPACTAECKPAHCLLAIYCRLGQLFAQWPACPQTKHRPPATPGTACPAKTMTAASTQLCMRHSTAPADTPRTKAIPLITLAKQGPHLWQMCMQEACQHHRRDAQTPVRAPEPPLGRCCGRYRGCCRGRLVIWALGCPP